MKMLLGIGLFIVGVIIGGTSGGPVQHTYPYDPNPAGITLIVIATLISVAGIVFFVAGYKNINAWWWFPFFFWLTAISLFIQGISGTYNAFTDSTHVLFWGIGAVNSFVASIVWFMLSDRDRWNRGVLFCFLAAFAIDLLGGGTVWAVSNSQGADPKNSVASLVIAAIASCFSIGLLIKAAALREK